MHLVIRAVSLDEQPLAEPLVGVFDGRGGTIGRSDANTLVLADPERRISRLQAEVSTRGDRCVVRNAGSAADIVVGVQALPPGAEAGLADGDQLTIGGYRLLVSLEEGADSPWGVGRHVAVDKRGQPIGAEPQTDPRWIAAAGARTPASGSARAVSPAVSGSAANPFAEILSASGSAAGADPFADLMGASAAPSAGRPSPHDDDPFAFVTTPAAKPAPGPAAGPRAAIPDDFDLFADLAPAPLPAATANPTPSAVGDDGLLASVGAGTGRRSTLDETFGLAAMPPGTDPLAAFMNGAMPAGPSPSGSAASSSLDPLAMFGAVARPMPASTGSAASDHVAQIQGAYKPPRIVAPPPEPAARREAPAALPQPLRAAPAAEAPVRPAQVATPPERSPAPPPDALWAAFCDGAGVQMPLPAGLTAAQMHVLGQLVAAAVAGLLPIARQGAGQAGPAAGPPGGGSAAGVNPLAVTADLAIALDHLLMPTRRGFLGGPEAIRETLRIAAQAREPAGRRPPFGGH